LYDIYFDKHLEDWQIKYIVWRISKRLECSVINTEYTEHITCLFVLR